MEQENPHHSEEVAHFNLAQAEAIRRKREKAGKWSALLITITVHVIAILILTLIILPALQVEVPRIQAKVLSQNDGPLETPTVTQSTVKSKPSAPSSSTRVISSRAPSSAVFVPTVATESTLNLMGTGIDTGLGLGFGGGGTGTGGSVGFFGQKSSARRVAFVIDYSASMKGQRDKIMRGELARSIKELKSGISYTLIFFAGPVWFAGEEINNVGNQNNAVVRGQDGTSYKWQSVKGANDWKLTSGKLPEVKWLDAGSSSNIRESLKHIKDSRLIYGTDWDDPLEIALDAKPRPDVVYFMTDGVAGGRSMETAEAIARRAKSGSSKVIINCISMMEPKALEPMKVMASRTGGQMTVINADGTRKVIFGPKKN